MDVRKEGEERRGEERNAKEGFLIELLGRRGKLRPEVEFKAADWSFLPLLQCIGEVSHLGQSWLRLAHTG